MRILGILGLTLFAANLAHASDGADHALLKSGAVSRDARYYAGIPGVMLIDKEVSPLTGLEDVRVQLFSTSFNVVRVAFYDSLRLFVYGVDFDGRNVLEEWLISPQDGGYAFTRPHAATPVGQPAPDPSADISVVGSVYVELGARPPLELKRERIYTGEEIGDIWGFLADPNGRYLLFLSEKHQKVFQIVLKANPRDNEAVVVLDHAELSDAHSIWWVQMDGYGRLCYLAGDDDVVTVMIDGDNDGVFEDLVNKPRVELLELPISYRNATDDFFSYQ